MIWAILSFLNLHLFLYDSNYMSKTEYDQSSFTCSYSKQQVQID